MNLLAYAFGYGGMDCHCEERSDETIPSMCTSILRRLLRYARNDKFATALFPDVSERLGYEQDCS
jgi:hypothetical protein